MIAKIGSQLVRGFLMGAADVVPGVSGGTIALILGIYEKLIDQCLSHELSGDARYFISQGLFRQVRWRAACERTRTHTAGPVANGLVNCSYRLRPAPDAVHR